MTFIPDPICSEVGFITETGYVQVADISKLQNLSGQPLFDGGSGVQLGETSTTAYRGDRGKIAYEHALLTGNPHGTVWSDLAGSLPLGQLPTQVARKDQSNTFTQDQLITGALTTSGNIIATAGNLKATNGNAVNLLGLSGASYGLRVQSQASLGMYIEAVDPTLVASYQPLILGGSAITLNAPTSCLTGMTLGPTGSAGWSLYRDNAVTGDFRASNYGIDFLNLTNTGNLLVKNSTSGDALGVDTGAAFTSNLLNLKVNGTSRMSVSAAGNILAAGATGNWPGVNVSGSNAGYHHWNAAATSMSGFAFDTASGSIFVRAGNLAFAEFRNQGTPGLLQLNSGSGFGWVSNTVLNSALSTAISQSSAGVAQIGTAIGNASGSLLLTNLTASGKVTTSAGSASVPSLVVGSTGLYQQAAGYLAIPNNAGTDSIVFMARNASLVAQFGFNQTGLMSWSNSASTANSATSLCLGQSSAGVLSVGTSAVNSSGGIACGAITASGLVYASSSLMTRTMLNDSVVALMKLRSELGVSIRNNADSADAPLTAGAITASGQITGSVVNAAAFRHSSSLVTIESSGPRINSTAAYEFSSSATNVFTGSDSNISRSSAGVLQVGTTAQNAAGSLLLTNLTASGTIQGGLVQAKLPSNYDGKAFSVLANDNTEIFRFENRHLWTNGVRIGDGNFPNTGGVGYWVANDVRYSANTVVAFSSSNTTISTPEVCWSRQNSTTIQIGTSGAANASGNLACTDLTASNAITAGGGVTVGKSGSGQTITGANTASNELVVSGGAGNICVLTSGAYGHQVLGSGRIGLGDVHYISWHNNSDGRGGGVSRISQSSAGVLQIGTTASNALGSLLLTNLTASGTVTSAFQTLTTDPTTTDLTASQSRLVKNSSTGTLKLWANDGGVMKSVALT